MSLEPRDEATLTQWALNRNSCEFRGCMIALSPGVMQISVVVIAPITPKERCGEIVTNGGIARGWHKMPTLMIM